MAISGSGQGGGPRRMRRAVLTIGLVIAAAASPGAAQAAPSCSDRRADQAAAAVDSLTDWRSFAHFWRRFGGCGGDGLDRKLADTVSGLLAEHWDKLPTLMSEVRRQPRLRGFVLGHIDPAGNPDQAAQIQADARARCPRGSKSLCREIGQAASGTRKGIS